MKLPPITLADIKAALRDPSFIASLPASLNGEMQKYMQNPGCNCNMSVVQKIINEATEQVKAYFPTKDLTGAKEAVKEAVKEAASNIPKIEHSQPNQQQQNPSVKNNFSVINCSIGEVEQRLKGLPPGRKQIAMARYEDQVTVIVNELDLVF